MHYGSSCYDKLPAMSTESDTLLVYRSHTSCAAKHRMLLMQARWTLPCRACSTKP
jgi:hypothetical protein